MSVAVSRETPIEPAPLRHRGRLGDIRFLARHERVSRCFFARRISPIKATGHHGRFVAPRCRTGVIRRARRLEGLSRSSGIHGHRSRGQIRRFCGERRRGAGLRLPEALVRGEDRLLDRTRARRRRRLGGSRAGSRTGAGSGNGISHWGRHGRPAIGVVQPIRSHGLAGARASGRCCPAVRGGGGRLRRPLWLQGRDRVRGSFADDLADDVLQEPVGGRGGVDVRSAVRIRRCGLLAQGGSGRRVPIEAAGRGRGGHRVGRARRRSNGSGAFSGRGCLAQADRHVVLLRWLRLAGSPRLLHE